MWQEVDNSELGVVKHNSPTIICKKCPHCSTNYSGDGADTHCQHDGNLLQPIYSDPWLGSTLANRYNIISAAGSGGWATVYMAEQVSLNRKVAVKILERRLLDNETLIKRFSREAEALSSLQHSSIVSIVDFGVLPQPYIVMEWLPGPDLSEFIRDYGTKTTFSQKLALCKELVEGLQHAHAAGIIHRDLKPSNIKIVFSAQRKIHAKILDFGLARLLSSGDEQVTRTGECVGSPAYMSPEQCQGRPTGETSDVYSLGCIMFELFSGRQMYVRQTVEEYFAAHIAERPQQLFAQPSLQEKALEQVIFKCLSKKPEQRYKSATQLLQALDELGQGKAAGNSWSGNLKPIALGSSGIALAMLAVAFVLLKPDQAQTGANLAAADKSKLVHIMSKPTKASPLSPNTVATVERRPDSSVLSASNGSVKYKSHSQFASEEPRSVALISSAKLQAESSSKQNTNQVLSKVSLQPITPSEKIASSKMAPDFSSKVQKEKALGLAGSKKEQVGASNLAHGTSIQPMQNKLDVEASESPSLPGSESHFSSSHLTWHDTVRKKDVHINFFRPDAANSAIRPVVLLASTNMKEQGEGNWLISSWLKSGYFVIVYDADNVPNPINPTHHTVSLAARQRASDISFVIAHFRQQLRAKDPLVQNAQGNIFVCAERALAVSVLATASAVPENRIWRGFQPLHAGIKGIILLSPGYMGDYQVYERIRQPLLVVSFADDPGTPRWDDELMGAAAFTRSINAPRFHIVLSRSRFLNFLVEGTHEDEQALVSVICKNFVEAVNGNRHATEFLCGDGAEKCVGKPNEYYYKLAESEDDEALLGGERVESLK